MSTKSPTVTIVTVVYNLYENGRVRTFKQAVESVQEQSYENIEHLIIDGDSNDRTKELLYKLNQDTRIRFISEPDNGIYDAMNKGIKNATGKYVAFLNSDDFYSDKDAIRESVNALEKNNADFSYSSAHSICEKSVNIFEGDMSTVISRMPFPHLTMFTKRSVLLKENGFDEKYGFPADYDLVLRLALNDYKYVKVPGVIATYRRGGATDKHINKYMEDIKNIYYDNYSDFYKFHIEQQAIDLKYKRKIPRDFVAKFKKYCSSRDFQNLKTKEIIDNLESLQIQGEVQFNAKLEKGRELLLSKDVKSISREKYKDKILEINDYGNTSKRKEVGIIVVSYRDGKDLLRCLDSFEEQTDKSFRIYLVDNGLSSEIRDQLKNYNIVHILLKENVGPSAGRNIGVCYAKEDLVAFIDSDGYVNRSYIESVKDIFKDKSKILVRGKIIPTQCSITMPPELYDIGNISVPIIPTTEGNLVIRKEDYIKVGGFEDPLYGHEGIVMAHRMINFYGYKEEEFYYDPRLVLYHDFEKVNNNEKEERQLYVQQEISKNYPNIQKTYKELYYTLNLISRSKSIKKKENLYNKHKKISNSRLYKILMLYYASKGSFPDLIKFPIQAIKIIFSL
jgi:glycosyltransferase involved in cell wall biosynthesis